MKSPQRKKSSKGQTRLMRASTCHSREGGNPGSIVPAHTPFHRNTATSAFVILAAAVMMYSFFSVVQAQSILKHEAPQCEGFVACTKLFFNNLWITLTGNPTPASIAQTPPGGNPVPAGVAVNKVEKTTTLIEAGPIPSQPAGGNNLILQPYGTDHVIIGQGTPDPQYKLDVFGSIRGERFQGRELKVDNSVNAGYVSAESGMTTPSLCLGSPKMSCLSNVEDFGPWKKVADGSDIFYTGGKVGIGTQVPIGLFQVDYQSMSYVPLGSRVSGPQTPDCDSPTFKNNQKDGDECWVNDGNNSQQFRLSKNSIESALTIRNSGYIGIGVSNPVALLEIKEGGAYKTGSTYLSGTSMGTFLGSNAQYNNLWVVPNKTRKSLGLEIYDNIFRVRQTKKEGSGNFDYSLVVDGDGNVGIGTAMPKEKLQIGDSFTLHDGGWKGMRRNVRYYEDPPGTGHDVRMIQGPVADIMINGSGDVVFRTAVSGSASSNVDWINGWEAGSMIIKNDGKVGIGTASPGTLGMGEKLEVNGGITSAVAAGSGTNAGMINLQNLSNEKVWHMTMRAGDNDKLQIYHHDGTTWKDNFFTMDTNGNVGIGTTTPGYKLDVKGDVNVFAMGENNLAYKNEKRKLALATDRIGFDVAEIFESEESVEVGDIVVVGTKERKVKKSERQYQSQVIGIVSGSPAVLFEGAELKIGSKPDRFTKGSKPPIALVGRVPVRVSLENGSIKIGDYLTTSSVSGVAMKATEIGPIIGVALESYDKGDEGRVLVFINISENNTEKYLKELKERIDTLERRMKRIKK